MFYSGIKWSNAVEKSQVEIKNFYNIVVPQCLANTHFKKIQIPIWKIYMVLLRVSVWLLELAAQPVQPGKCLT